MKQAVPGSWRVGPQRKPNPGPPDHARLWSSGKQVIFRVSRQRLRWGKWQLAEGWLCPYSNLMNTVLSDL